MHFLDKCILFKNSKTSKTSFFYENLDEDGAANTYQIVFVGYCSFSIQTDKTHISTQGAQKNFTDTKLSLWESNKNAIHIKYVKIMIIIRNRHWNVLKI